MAEFWYFSLVLVSCSMLSVVGCLFIIVLYLLTPDLDALINRQVFFLALSDLIMSLGYLITPWTFNLDPDSNTILCQTQAILLSFSRKTSIFISFLIYYSIYLVIVDLYPRLEKQIHVQGFIDEVDDVKYLLSRKIYILTAISFAIALIVTPLPLFTDDYGPVEQSWCFLKMQNTYMDYVWMLVQFQGFFIAFIVCCVYFQFRIFSVISEVKREKGKFQMYEQVKKKLIWYPIFLILCFLPIISNRLIQKMIEAHYDYAMARCIVGAICSLNGFANMLVFGFSGGFFEALCSSSEEDASSPLLTN